MLRLKFPEVELYNEETEEFFTIPPQTLELEHSLSAISIWESIWKKPFFDERTPKTSEELIDYVRCMTLNEVDDRLYEYLPASAFKAIDEYMNDSMTATTFRKTPGGPSGQIVTSELIYYWMTVANIPFNCDKWHLNRLLTLIQVCNIKNAPAKKMGKNELRQQNAAINAARRARLHTKG